uniref:Reverse transcriptase domain-containing protein n=1 Tax=Leptobrachium leishanense TaxID=445787 RepID=A0A8C5R0F1_9ANUR
MKYTKRMYYEKSNKADSMLARKLRSQYNERIIPRIRTMKGRVVTNPEDIATEFGQTLQAIYDHAPHQTVKDPALRDRILQFLHKADLPKLTTSQSERLGAPIKEEEVAAALKSFKSGKAPGPDGYTCLYYKTFLNIFLTPLTIMYNSLMEGKPLTADMQSSTLALIPKPGKDPLDPLNYRPIALLNIDYKIFTKILSTRLNPFLPTLIHADQVGFVPHRQARDNTRRCIDLIWVAQTSNLSTLFLSLDAEKAFDRLTWPFMFHTLTHVGIPHSFYTAITALYDSPTALLPLPGACPRRIDIRNGTRQGCPLSPLLFALCIEPLLSTIRHNSDISGITVGMNEYKVAAYADDLFLTLSRPMRSLPYLFDLLDTFASLSGFKINKRKSAAFPINLPASSSDLLALNFSLPISSSPLTYLGLKLSPHLDQLYDLNYTPLLTQIKHDIDSWQEMSISWLGRLNSIKMNVLPRLLYLFQSLPIHVPPNALKDMQQRIDKFVWSGRRPRIARRLMYIPKTSGGLALPNLKLYLSAALLTQIAEWHLPIAQKRWVDIENDMMLPDLLPFFMWLPKSARKDQRLRCPLVSHSLHTWDTLSRKFSLTAEISPLLPLYRNPWFLPGMTPQDFNVYDQGDISRIADLMVDGHLRTYADIATELPLTSRDLFRYLQLSSFVSQHNIKQAATLTPTWFEKICLRGTTFKGAISSIYQSLVLHGHPGHFPYMLKWQADIGEELDEEDWSEIWEANFKSSGCITHMEQSVKTLFRWYLTPVRLHHMHAIPNGLCWRGCGQLGTYYHQWWLCPKLRPYWATLADWLHQALERPVEINPWTFLLSRPVEGLLRCENKLIARVTLIARRALARHWNQPTLPSYPELSGMFTEARMMEQLTAQIHDTPHLYLKIWAAWIGCPALP